MYKLLLCWRYLTHALHRLDLHRERDARRGDDDCRQQCNGRVYRRDASSHERHAGRSGFESRSMDGVLDAPAHMAKIREVAGDAICGMSPTVHVPSLMYIELNGQLTHNQATLVGIDEKTYSGVSQFGDCLTTSREPRAAGIRLSRRRLRRLRPPRSRSH